MLAKPAAVGGCILIVEDDADIRELIARQLRGELFRVEAAGSMSEARALMQCRDVDLLVLDLNLPDGDGSGLCRQLRAEGYEQAIIMVTARDAAVERVLGLELGADDYLTKPFEPRELLARVRNLLKRTRAREAGRPRNAKFARFGSWRLDLFQRRLVGPDERLVMLSAAEYRLLSRFIDAPNRVLSREELVPERSATAAFDRTIDQQISRLRQKLSTSIPDAEIILTVRNEGYVMPGPVAFE